jgi:hypothetical protein
MNQPKQSRWIEQILNVGSGFIVSLIFWVFIVVPVWDLPVNMNENLQITACFTILSIIRGYIWRTLFNKYQWGYRK